MSKKKLKKIYIHIIYKTKKKSTVHVHRCSWTGHKQLKGHTLQLQWGQMQLEYNQFNEEDIKNHRKNAVNEEKEYIRRWWEKIV